MGIIPDRSRVQGVFVVFLLLGLTSLVSGYLFPRPRENGPPIQAPGTQAQRGAILQSRRMPSIATRFRVRHGDFAFSIEVTPGPDLKAHSEQESSAPKTVAPGQVG